MIQLFQRMKNKKGFTLIELIVVIAIIAILILIAVPAYQAFVETSQRRSDYASAATLYKAAQLYYVEADASTGVVAASVASGVNNVAQFYPENASISGITATSPSAAILNLIDDAFPSDASTTIYLD